MKYINKKLILILFVFLTIILLVGCSTKEVEESEIKYGDEIILEEKESIEGMIVKREGNKIYVSEKDELKIFSIQVDEEVKEKNQTIEQYLTKYNIGEIIKIKDIKAYIKKDVKESVITEDMISFIEQEDIEDTDLSIVDVNGKALAYGYTSFDDLTYMSIESRQYYKEKDIWIVGLYIESKKYGKNTVEVEIEDEVFDYLF